MADEREKAQAKEKQDEFDEESGTGKRAGNMGAGKSGKEERQREAER